MNIDRLLLFLTEYEKIALHFFYPDHVKEYNKVNNNMGNAVDSLINLGLLEEVTTEKDKERLYQLKLTENKYKLTRNGRIFCDTILEKP